MVTCMRLALGNEPDGLYICDYGSSFPECHPNIPFLLFLYLRSLASSLRSSPLTSTRRRLLHFVKSRISTPASNGELASFRQNATFLTSLHFLYLFLMTLNSLRLKALKITRGIILNTGLPGGSLQILNQLRPNFRMHRYGSIIQGTGTRPLT